MQQYFPSLLARRKVAAAAAAAAAAATVVVSLAESRGEGASFAVDTRSAC